MGIFGNLIPQLISSGIIKKVDSTSTPTNNDLNNSPRYVDINQPRTAQFAGADVNANTYGKGDADNLLKKIFNAKEGGEVLAKGNKLAKHRPTKLY